MKFGADKWKLLISARPKKMKVLKNLLTEEPEILTFFYVPVNMVEDHYVHIGVP